jgi:hypothetical protein
MKKPKLLPLGLFILNVFAAALLWMWLRFENAPAHMCIIGALIYLAWVDMAERMKVLTLTIQKAALIQSMAAIWNTPKGEP